MRPLGSTPLQLIKEYNMKKIETFHARNIHVLAEGIECKEELEFLLTTKADYLQGFFI